MEGSLVLNWNFDQKRRSVIINAKESDIYQSPRIALTASIFLRHKCVVETCS